MAYNHRRAELEWLKWKQAEEQKLRALGVDEDTIQRLHTYDWAEFNRERRYLSRKADWPSGAERIPAQAAEAIVSTADTLLDRIENEKLFELLRKADKLTLDIVILKMGGFSSKEISKKLSLSASAVNYRMWALREKIKKIF